MERPNVASTSVRVCHPSSGPRCFRASLHRLMGGESRQPPACSEAPGGAGQGADGLQPAPACAGPRILLSGASTASSFLSAALHPATGAITKQAFSTRHHRRAFDCPLGGLTPASRGRLARSDEQPASVLAASDWISVSLTSSAIREKW